MLARRWSEKKERASERNERREYIKQTPYKYVFRPTSFIRNASRGQTTA
jgi:hypothetical protein